MRPLSIRWKLTGSAFAVTLVIAIVLAVVFQRRTHGHLLDHLEDTLETKADEVQSVLGAGTDQTAVDALFGIETTYRSSPYTYYYQIADLRGRVLIRSANLHGASLPIPMRPPDGAAGHQVTFESTPGPLSPAPIRIRTERIASPGGAWGGNDLLVQVAISLDPLDALMQRHLLQSIGSAALGLATVLLLLWIATARALRPVARMTQRASLITATNLGERLPLAGTGDELDQLAHVLNGMLERLDRSLKQMEQFTSDAAHQLRTPLTRIRGELDLMLRDGVPAPLRGQLERVQEELEHLSRVCGRLLLLARLDQEKIRGQLDTNAVNLHDVLVELTDQMTPLAYDKAVHLQRGPMCPAVVRGSKALIVEAVLNLLHNALRFTGADGTVEVSLTAEGGRAVVAVTDSGPGIAPDEQELIFRRFYRVSGSSGDFGEGTGLGLSIVKAIAGAHGGDVDVRSTPGHGSCFRLLLPASAS